MFEQLGLIGCGLMGGSFALALKRAGLVKRVVGYSKSPSTTERARQLGVIEVEAPSALLAVSGADLVLLAVPVSATESTFKAIRHLITKNTLVMDVGSTKRDVVDTARRVLKDQVGIFVPAHPIAGKELSGVEHADVDLYTGRQVILTPIERTMTVQLEKAQKLWTALDCEVKLMSPEAHDAAFAAVSHLPHMISFALMNAIKGQEQAEDFLALAGPGGRADAEGARVSVFAGARRWVRELHSGGRYLSHSDTISNAPSIASTHQNHIEAMLRRKIKRLFNLALIVGMYKQFAGLIK